MHCHSNGLRLAKLSSREELITFIAKFRSKFPKSKDEILFDGSKLESHKCLAITLKKINGSFLRNASCTEEKLRFLCEFDEKMEFDNETLTLDDDKIRFLKHIGNKSES